MIIEGLFNLIFGLIELVITFLPVPVLNLTGGASGLTTILAYGLYFFPADIWMSVITLGVTMLSTGLLWAIIEWVYKKIPGVD
jgi:hypothetical protein